MTLKKKVAKLFRDPDLFFEDYFAKRRKRARAQRASGPAQRTTRKINPRLVVYESFHGASISCNPYAIFSFLLEDPRFRRYRHIWIVNDPDRYAERFAAHKNVRFVGRGTERAERALEIAKYLVSNNTFSPSFTKRPGQVYVNTQHGVPIKTMGEDAHGTFALGANVTRKI